MTRRDERLLSAVSHAVAEYIGRESNRTTLITVTRAELSNSGDHIELMVSVMPTNETGTALDFLNRKRSDMSEFIKKRVELRAIPRLTFLPDPEMEGKE